MPYLDDHLLERYALKRLGYGNRHALLWFVGPEEGGGADFDEVDAKLRTWARRGCPAVDDLREFSLDTGIRGVMKWFLHPFPIQKTWGPLVRIALSVQGAKSVPDTVEVKEFQVSHLGSPNGNTALFELMPFPAPTLSRFPISQMSGLSWLRNRDTQREYLLPKRVALIRELATACKPRFVIFYGFMQIREWEALIGRTFRQLTRAEFGPGSEIDDKLLPYEQLKDATHYLVIPHPAATPPKNTDWNGYWHDVGTYVRRKLCSEPERPL